MWYGSLSLQEIARAQGGLLFGWIPKWGIVTQPLAFILFLTAASRHQAHSVRHAGGRI